MRVASFLLALTLLAGCSSDPKDAPITPVVDSSTDDTNIAPDTAPPADTGTTSDTSVADVADAPPKFDILGTLGGDCGGLVAELSKTTPSVYGNAVTFVMGEKYARESMSVPDGQRIFDTANAGGSSGESEVMSFEILHYCEDATLLKTETEIKYLPPDDSGPNSITDILVKFGGKAVGVSVTRAYKPAPMTMSDAEVKALLEKKLEGVIRSTARQAEPTESHWNKQILHVFVASADMDAAVKRVLPTIDAAIRADTIVLITRTAGGGFIYCNPDPALGSECPPI